MITPEQVDNYRAEALRLACLTGDPTKDTVERAFHFYRFLSVGATTDGRFKVGDKTQGVEWRDEVTNRLITLSGFATTDEALRAIVGMAQILAAPVKLEA